ncbi:MAG: acetylxylan esterase [Candidatus Sumerlaeia bacterium]|nr:acetylxylan esterase [Candidatus Sumerlaeia bacterium]
MAHPSLERRAFIQAGTLTAGGLFLSAAPKTKPVPAKVESSPSVAAPAEAVQRAPIFSEYRYGHVVQEYYVKRVREIAARRARERARIRTPEAVMKLREEVRRKLKECYGPWPERTPLNVRVTGTVEREHYTIEKILYESLPNYLVTANLYLPKNVSGRRPAVVAPCGHSANGKAAAPYQEFSRNLARQGYIVLIYDPPAQGERLEYPDREGEPRIGFGTHSHNLAGNQMTLIGRHFSLWEAWDGIRALDYLLSRPDVDPARIGVTGNSGGGTLTSHLNALDDRFTMAAPNCYVTRFLYNLENEEPTDAEQIAPGMLAAELDMADFFIAQLPRPTHFGGEVNDFFDVRGLRETYEEVRRLYALVGAEQNVELFIGKRTHGYNPEARVAMYRFFNKHAGIEASPDEPQLPVESDETLQVTPKGQVHLMGSARTFDFTRDAANALAKGRKAVGGKELAGLVAKHLALPKRAGIPHYRALRPRTVWDNPRFLQHAFLLETEPPAMALLHAVVNSGAVYYFPEGEQAVLYIAHRSSLKEIILGQAPETDGQPVRWALDVRGIGEMTARIQRDSGNDFFHNYRSDYMYANHGLLLNEPYSGRRVHDVLCTLDLFQWHGCRDIHLVGRGLGAIWAAFAAVVHPIVRQVTLHNALLSYHELTQDERYAWPLSSMVFGILRHFDLSDCLRELAATKKLTLVNPWNSRMELWDKEKLASHLKALRLEKAEVRWAEI